MYLNGKFRCRVVGAGGGGLMASQGPQGNNFFPSVILGIPTNKLEGDGMITRRGGSEGVPYSRGREDSKN